MEICYKGSRRIQLKFFVGHWGNRIKVPFHIVVDKSNNFQEAGLTVVYSFGSKCIFTST